MNNSVALALDIGGSKLIAGYVDGGGNLLCSEKRTWSRLDSESVVSDVIEASRSIQNNNPQYSPCVIGASIPGLADPENGMWVEASFSGIKNLPISAILNKTFALPVFIGNDGCACALAEHRFGCCEGVDDFIWVTVSNGIGGAVFSGGSLYMGSIGNAGEIGHVVVEEGLYARQCKCGLRGCAEMHASGRGLVMNYLALGGSLTINGETPDAVLIGGLARSGDAIALETYRLEGLYLGRALGAAVNILNPQRVVLGGGVSLGFDLYKDALLKSLYAHIYRGANPHLTVETTALGYHASLIGAATLGFIGLEKGEAK